MKRIFVNSVLIAAGFLLGGGLGAYLTFAIYAHRYPVIRAFAWAEIALGVSEYEFDSNSKNAILALQNTLFVYDRDAKSPNVDPELKKALQLDRGMFEAQLSVLEKESGNTDQASVYMTKAKSDMKGAGWMDYSEETILRTYRRQPVPPCTNSSQGTAAQATSVAKKPCG